MAVHPKIADVLRTLPAPPDGPLDPVAMRAEEAAHLPPITLEFADISTIVAATPEGEVTLRVYRANEDPSGIIAYIHGGAFFLGSLDTHDHVARALAHASGCTVVSVGYRLAPENPYPSGLRDCYGAVRWIIDHPAVVGWDGSTLAIVGDSSGGTLAAAVTALAHDDGIDAITHQVLLYPSLDLDFDEDRYASLRENAVGYGLETAGLKPFNAFYLDSGADPADPLVSPIKRTDLSGLPAALVITAEHDPLRDEGELYGARLSEAGVAATVIRYAGATHGFLQHFAWIPEYASAFEEVGAFITGPR